MIWKCRNFDIPISQDLLNIRYLKILNKRNYISKLLEDKRNTYLETFKYNTTPNIYVAISIVYQVYSNRSYFNYSKQTIILIVLSNNDQLRE